MIKKIKFFINGSNKAFELGKICKEKFINNGIEILGNKYDLALLIGNNNEFSNMLKIHNYNENMCFGFINISSNYIDLNSIDNLIYKIKNEKYDVNELDLIKMKIDMGNYLLSFFASDKVIIRNPDLEDIKINIYIDNIFFEQFNSDGIIFSNVTRKQLGDALIQIIPTCLEDNLFKKIGLISNNKQIKSLFEKQNLICIIDDKVSYYNNVSQIEIENDHKKIKCIKLENFDKTM